MGADPDADGPFVPQAGAFVLRGPAGAEVGAYDYVKWGRTRRVRVFRVEALAEHAAWPEQIVRERRWVPFAAAAAMVREPGLARLLAELHARHAAGGC